MLKHTSIWVSFIGLGALTAPAFALGPGGIECRETINPAGKPETQCENVIDDVETPLGPGDSGKGSTFGDVPRGIIFVRSATYGFNCGAHWGNQTQNLANACNAISDCQYPVDFTAIGDPAVGCAKDYTVIYKCANQASVQIIKLPPEAGFRSVAHLHCKDD